MTDIRWGILATVFWSIVGFVAGLIIALHLAYPVLKGLMRRVDHRRYNGAALLGLRGLVFKSHGSADAMAFEQALNRAYDAARNNLLDRVRSRIAAAAPLLLAAQTDQATSAS